MSLARKTAKKKFQMQDHFKTFLPEIVFDVFTLSIAIFSRLKYWCSDIFQRYNTNILSGKILLWKGWNRRTQFLEKIAPIFLPPDFDKSWLWRANEVKLLLATSFGKNILSGRASLVVKRDGGEFSIYLDK